MPKSFLIKKKQKRKHQSLRHEVHPESPVKIFRTVARPTPISPVKRRMIQPDDLGSDAENVPPSPSSPVPYVGYAGTLRCKFI